MRQIIQKEIQKLDADYADYAGSKKEIQKLATDFTDEHRFKERNTEIRR